MKAEMRNHLDLEAEYLVARGLTPHDARRQAAAVFGGTTQAIESARDLRGSPALAELWRSARLASRTLIRHRAFAIMTIVTLALTIAASTTAFSMLDAVLNPRFHAREPDRLYTVKVIPDPRLIGQPFPKQIERSLAGGGATFESYAVSGPWRGFFVDAVAERGRLTRAATVRSVSANYFPTVGVQPLEGQLTLPGGSDVGSDRAVISDRLRGELFSEGESAVPGTILVNGRPITVVGVVKRYEGIAPLSDDVWILEPRGVPFSPWRLVRIREHATPAQLRTELEALGERAASQMGLRDMHTAFVPAPLAMGMSAQSLHYALIGAGVAVLLIACLNLANLQLARAMGRGSEMAAQAALGATRRHIIMQLLAENAVLVGLGLVLALLLTVGAAELIRVTVPRGIGQLVVAPEISWRMVSFAVAGSALAVALVGAIPAMSVSRVDLNSLLKHRAGSGTSRGQRERYGALVVLQIALAMPLTVGAIMLIGFLWAMTRPNATIERVGYDPAPIIRGQLRWTRTDSGGPISLGEIAPRRLQAITAIPGVHDAALAVGARPAGNTVTVEDGSGEIREVSTLLWNYQIVTPNYFRTLGRPIVSGEDFPVQGAEGATVILDANTANTLWPRANPIGRAIKFGDTRSASPWLRVRGIVGNRYSPRQRELLAAGGSLRLTEAYRLMARTDTAQTSIYKRYEAELDVRTDSTPPVVASALRRYLAELDDAYPPRVQLLTEYLGIPQQIAVMRFMTALFTVFGVLALGLACLGIYGIVTQHIVDHRRDLGIRLALGASPRVIVAAVLRAQNVFALLGIAIGLALTAFTAQWIGGFVGGIGIGTVAVYAGTCVLLFSCAVGSALVPAVRAARIAPMEVLRAD
jgi:putative ABC transport system permease protein